MQHPVLPDSKTTKRTLPYNRQYVIFAVYEVLDKNGAEYEKTDESTILAEMSVYGIRLGNALLSLSAGD